MKISRITSSLLLLAIIGWLSIVHAQDSVAINEENIPLLDPNQSKRFISDDLFVYLRSGPSDQYRIIGSVSAGEPVNLIPGQRENGFVKIRTADNTAGWVQIRFVSRRFSVHQLYLDSLQTIDQLNQQLKSLEQQLLESKAEMSQMSEQVAQQQLTNEQLTAQVEIAQRAQSQQRSDDRKQLLSQGALIAACCILIGFLLGIISSRTKQKRSLF